MNSGSTIKHEAFLAFWLSRFVFPHSPYLIAVLLAIGTRISIAPAILARIHRDLSLLKEKDFCFSLVCWMKIVN